MQYRIGFRGVLDLVATVAMLVAALVILYNSVYVRSPAGSPEGVTRATVSLDDAWTVGSTNAPFALVVFSDFQCSVCARFSKEIWPEMKATFVDPGRVLFVFRHMPNEVRHPYAMNAAAAECAGRQQQFWPMHDLIFSRQELRDADAHYQWAGALNLGMEDFRACMSSPPIEKIRRDAAAAQALDVRGTPYFLFGKKVGSTLTVSAQIKGLRPALEFQKLLEDAIRIN